MTEELFTMRDAARILRTQPYVIAYCLATKKVPEPLRIGGRRMFTHGDLARLGKYIKVTPQINGRRGGNAK